MPVSTPTETIIARTTPTRAPRAATNAQRATPLVSIERGHLTGIEGDAFGASTELVHLRDDLDDAVQHDGEHDTCLAAALRVPGLPAAARELILRAQAADRREDAAIYERATERRHRAHSHTRSVAGRIELALTGRCREDVLCERDDPHPLAECGVKRGQP